MERIMDGLRQKDMMYPRQVRGIVVAGMLCAAVAACGTQVATATSAEQAKAAAPAVGCAGVDQATSVTVHRSMDPIEPGKVGTLNVTQHNAALVHALFQDYCKVIAHPYNPTRPVNCPMAFGLAYTGTFYDGKRELATFTYSASGCQTITLTTAGKTKRSLIMGPAATVAPGLDTDLAKVLGLPKSDVYSPEKPATGTPPGTNINPGGPDKPA